MPEYDITWGTDIEHDTPREAAQAALDLILGTDPRSLARVFTVIDKETGIEHTIDLSPGAGTEDVDLSTDAPFVLLLEDPALAGFEAPLEGHGVCVVCLVGNAEIEHDPADHQAVGVHEVSGVPTSEWCSGASTCPDCKDFLIQQAVDAVGAENVRERLEYLRGELRAERISQGELIELQGLAEYIEPGDVELLEPAGVPEFPESDDDAVPTEVLIQRGYFTAEALTPAGLRERMIQEAAGLLEPGEERSNPEYLRGMVELTCYVLGLGTEGHREDIEAAILAAVR